MKKHISPYQIKINGEGVPPNVTAKKYIDMIEDDFSLTLNDITNYLSCGYDYVQKNVAPNIRHIVINEFVRIALFKDYGDYADRHLFKKRILLSKKDFDRYIRDHSKIVYTRQPLNLSDFSEDTIQAFIEIAKEESVNSTHVAEHYIKLATKKYSSMILKYQEEENEARINGAPLEDIQPNNDLSSELLSLKSIKTNKIVPFSFNHNSEFYRFIYKYAIPKIIINNSLIRYRKKDLLSEDTILSLPLNFPKKVIIKTIEKEIVHRLK